MIESQYFRIPNDWEYRGEGNSHVVLGLPKLKRVIRIRKRNRPRNFLQWLFYFIEDYILWWYNNGYKAEERDLNFHLKIMRPLLGFKYVSDAKQVQLCKRQVRKIEHQLATIRPDFRKHKVLHFKRATLFRDFTNLNIETIPFKVAKDTFSVEIKPKKGWIPFSERNFPECIFCMNQYIKLETKRISELSRYCPKDLFSGEEVKIKKSLLSLLDNPQNNLRIFQNGHIVYDETRKKSEIEKIMGNIFQNSNEAEHSKGVEKLTDEFVDLMFKCLTQKQACSDNCQSKLFCEWDIIMQGDSLPRGCILEKILSVQMLDVEGTTYYSKQINDSIPEWAYVNKLFRELDTEMCVKCAISTLSSKIDSKRKDLIFAPYLIAAVANDCSLMVTVKKILDEELHNEENSNIIKTRFGSFLVNIGVFDLYPKPMRTIKKHNLRNAKLLKIYESMKKRA